MAFARYTRAVDHFFEVSEILAAIAALWRDAGALLSILLTCLLRSTLSAISSLSFVFSVSNGFLFLISGRFCCCFRASFFLRWRQLYFESRRKFALLHQSLLKQIVHCGHLVVLVAIQALSCIVLFETIAFEISEKGRLDRNLILSNDQALAFADGLIRLIPRVLLDLICCQPLIRVRFKNFVDQIDTVSREALGHLELPAENFLVQLSR